MFRAQKHRRMVPMTALAFQLFTTSEISFPSSETSFTKRCDLRVATTTKAWCTRTWLSWAGPFRNQTFWSILSNYIWSRRACFLRFPIFQICIPILQISLFCMCIGREPFNLDFGIVNNETIYNSSRQDASVIFVNELNNKTFNKVHGEPIFWINLSFVQFESFDSIIWIGRKRIGLQNSAIYGDSSI